MNHGQKNEEMPAEADEGPSENSYHSSESESKNGANDPNKFVPNVIGNAEDQVVAAREESLEEEFKQEEPLIKKITVEEFEAMAHTKVELHEALSVEGQLFIPCLKQCPLRFLKQLLKKQKLALRRSETSMVNIPRMKMVTVESVLKVALDNVEISKYLPDREDLDGDYIQRDYLFTLVHSLEPTFFKRALAEYHEHYRKEKLKKNEDIVEIDSEMLQILQNYRRNSFKQSQKKARSGIRALRVGKMKKKRKTAVQPPALTTGIGEIQRKENEDLNPGKIFYKIKRQKLS
jgi:hypothetical protein